MILTFNPDKYKELLTAYLPKLIKSEAEKSVGFVCVAATSSRPASNKLDFSNIL
ncbi:MAG: hypothetical protein ACYTXA_03100 [Nostoc sp.]